MKFVRAFVLLAAVAAAAGLTPFSAAPVAAQSAPHDTEPPRLLRGEIDGATMTLTFSEALDPDATGGEFLMGIQTSQTQSLGCYATGEVAVDGATVTVGMGKYCPPARAGLTGRNRVTYFRRADGGDGSLRDLAGNLLAADGDAGVGLYVEIDLANMTGGAPRVTGVAVVSDAGADQTYGGGEEIEVVVTFDRPVDVTGTPRLKIDMDPAEWGEQWAAYERGSGTASLTFVHTVAEPNLSKQGIAVLANTLELSGGTIRAGDAAAEVAHAGVAHDANHKVDWQRAAEREPLTARFVDVPATHGGVDSAFSFGLEFSEALERKLSSARLRTEALRATNATVTRTKRVVKGDNRRWTVTVRPESGAEVTVSLPATADCAAAGALCTADGRGLSNAVTATVSPAAASVTGVAVVSTPGEGDTYALGETVRVAVTFSEAVTVTGTPRLKLDLGAGAGKWAEYDESSATNTLEFAWTVARGDASGAGVAVPADTLQLNGGGIRAAARDQAVDLAHAGLAPDPSHKVDGAPDTTPPRLSATAVAGTKLTLSFDEAIDGAASPASGAFTVKRTPPGSSEQSVRLSGTPAIEGARVTLTLAEAVRGADTDVKVSYRKSGSEAGNRLRDAAGNEVAAFADEPVTNVDADTTPPELLRGKIDGGTVTLYFSEPLDPDSVGGQFRVQVQFGIKSSSIFYITSRMFFATGDVEISGSTVTVGLGLGDPPDTISKSRAITGGTNNVASYYPSLDPAAKVLRDLAGNPVSTPYVSYDGRRRTRLIPLDNVTGPVATAVAVVSDTDSDNTYELGETVRVAVTFIEAVNVTGTPRVKIDLSSGAGDEKWADYASGTGKKKLEFAYRVAQGDASSAGVAVLANTLELNGGTIRSVANSKDAALLHDGLDHDPKHRVGAGPPTLSVASVDGTALTLTFNETLGAAASLANGAFTVKKTPQGGGEQEESLSGSPAISGATVTLTLANAVLETDTDVKVSYAKPTTGTGNRLRDKPGNEVASFSDQAVTNGSRSPRVERAQIDDLSLTLTFDESLGAAASLANGAFTVKKTPQGGNEQTVSLSGSPAISGATVTLTLANPVLETDTGVKVSYAKPTTGTGNRLRDEAGNEVASFTDQAVTNGSRSPTLSVASVDGATLTLTFDEALGAAARLANGAFTVKKTPRGGNEQTVSLSGSPSIAGATVTLTLANPVLVADTGVKVSYAKPTSGTGNRLRDEIGNEVASFTGQAVTNGSRSPTLSVASVDGTALTLTFNGALGAAASLATSAFTVKKTPQGGNEQTVSLSGSPSIAGATVTLTLANPVLETDTGVKVSYAKPTSGTGNRLRDEIGNEVASFTDQAVTNGSRSPRVERAQIDGLSLTLTFDEALGAAASLANGAFTVKKTPQGGNEQTVSLSGSPSIGGATVTLTLANAVLETDTGVKVSYARPTSGTDNRLRDEAGNEVASFSDQAVANVNGDTTLPELVWGEIDGGTVALYFSEPLDPDSVGGEFQVVVRYGEHGASQFTATGKVEVSGNKVTVGTGDGNPRAKPGLNRNLAYYRRLADPTAEALRDLAGNPVRAVLSRDVRWLRTPTLILDNVTGVELSVTGVEVSSDAVEDTYGRGETIRVRLSFSKAVIVTGAPRVRIDFSSGDGDEKWADYVGGSGTRMLEFAYTVVEPNVSTQGIAVLSNTLELNGGTIRSAAKSEDATLAHRGLSHDANHKVDWRRSMAPAVTGATISSDAGADRTYARGETIRMTVTFSAAVNVTGTPRLKLDLRAGTGDEEWADYEAGSGMAELEFAYTVARGDASTAGVAMLANTLELNGGTIRSVAGSRDAKLAHGELDHDPKHKVDGAPPTLSEATVDGATLTLTFNETLGAAASLANGAFTVKKTPQGSSEQTVSLSGSPAISGATVTLMLANAVLETDTDVKVSYAKPTSGTGNRLRDAAGNDAANFAEQSVRKGTPDTTPPRLERGEIDGGTVTLVFSEPLDPDSVGGYFRVSVQYEYNHSTVYRATGEVNINGRTVTVGLGPDRQWTPWAKPGLLRYNEASYFRSTDPTATMLRDLAGNPVYAPYGPYDPNGEYRRTRTVFLTNVTAVTPTVTGVAVSSDAGADRTYVLDETIEVTLTFSEAVDVTGTPRVRIDFSSGAGDEQWADYEEGSGTKTLKFTWTVAQGDASSAGVAVLANTLELNGGTIRSAAESEDAKLAHAGLAHDPKHRVDTTPPTLSVASVDGLSLTLTFNETLGAAASLANGAFTVKKTPQGGNEQTVSLSGSPAISGATVTLTLANPVLETDTGVKVSYAKPTSGTDNRLRDEAGNEVVSFSDQPVTNGSRSPALSVASVDGATLTLVFDEALGAAARLANGAFTVKKSPQGGNEQTVSLSGSPSIDGATVTLTLANPVLETDTGVKVSYAKPTTGTGNRLRDEAGNEVMSFTDQTVTNGSRLPTLSVASVDGTALTLTFNGALGAAASLATSAFTVKKTPQGGNEQTVSLSGSPSIAGATVTLTLANRVLETDTGVKVSYAKPTTGTGNRLRDEAGNEVASFTDQAVTNGSRPPTLSVASVKGATLKLAFDETLGAAASLANGAFTVKRTPQGGNEQTVSLSGSPSIDGATVTLTLANAVLETDTGVKVSYARPTSGTDNRLRDEAGNEVASFSDQAAANVSGDTTPPRLVRGEIDGGTMTLYFSEPLAPDSVGGRFRVFVRLPMNVNREFTAAGKVEISGNVVTVGLGEGLHVRAGVTDNHAIYIRPADPGAKVLRDLAGNPVTASNGWSRGWVATRVVILDNLTGPPSVVGVAVSSDAGGDQTYALDETIEVTLTFSEAVNVTGTPRVKIDLSSGAGDEQWADYEEGSGTKTLDFAYEVAEPNVSTQGIAVLANTLELNGGAIRSVAKSKEAALSHAGLAHDPNHRVDTPPSVTGVTVSSEAGGDATYGFGETIRVTVTFSEAVTVTGSPVLSIDMDPAEWGEKRAAYESGSGTAALVFAHVVAEPNLSTEGIAVLANTLALNGGTIESATTAGESAALAHVGLAHDPAHKVDWQASPDAGGNDGPATVTGVAVTSEAGDDATYGFGETIRVTVAFSAAVTVTGSPVLSVDMDPAEWGEKRAAYESGSGTAALVFAYEVVEPNFSTQGIAVLADSLALNGGTIRSAADQADAALGHGGLGHDAAHKVDWRPLISVADARANEGAGAKVAFEVSLSRAFTSSEHAVTVDYATADGTAVAGEDYTAASGTLTFAAGETAKTVNVAVLDDAVDEGEETFVLRLSNATGGRIADGEATGTIANDDPLQKMWLSRFGRTVAGHVTEAVSDRLGAPLTGARVTVGGRSVDLAQTEEGAVLRQALTAVARALGASEQPASGDGTALGVLGSPTRAGVPAGDVSGRELLDGSAFHLAGEGDGGGPGLAAWGRMTFGGFDGEERADAGRLSIEGEVTSGILGADVAWNGLLAGVAVSVIEGEGTFSQAGVDTGKIESRMTAVSPYARLKLNERISVWGLAGWGMGDMTIEQAANEKQDERVTRTDIEMRVGGLGGRGALLESDETGGMDLGLKADAFYVDTKAEAISNEGGTTAVASRVRLALEGSGSWETGGGVLTPGVEFGVRHDGGDAETGTGVEIGGSVRYTDPAAGLSVEARVRTLLAHEDTEYREWGASGAVRLAPGDRGRGVSFSLAPTYGTASSGVERLWSARDARGLTPGDGGFEPERRLEGELGYGLALFGDRFTGTPNLGFGVTDGSRDYRIGWRLTSAESGAAGFEVSLDATRRETVGDHGPVSEAEHGVMLRGAIRW